MKNKFTKISPVELWNRISNGKPLVIIDTLPAEIFQQRKIPKAKNACVYEVTFPEQVEASVSDRQAEIILYGASDASFDAITAAEKLERLGYQNVHVLDGGAYAWHTAGYPLEGENIEAAMASSNKFSLQDGTYTVDTAKSTIEWTGRNPNGKHYGRVQLATGKMNLANNAISGRFEIDMTSIENIDLAGDELQPVLISHLKSDDFFFVKMFPAAFFSIKTATPFKEPELSAPNYDIEGILELRGVRQKINFPATLSSLSNGTITAEAHFDFDRTRWNVIYGSSRFFEHLGMHLVFDPISIQLRIIAIA
jgi:polyisoprenoid-binding protein YceI/rhodanese-related sulfurtransferase